MGGHGVLLYLHSVFNKNWRNVLSTRSDDEFLDTASDLTR